MKRLRHRWLWCGLALTLLIIVLAAWQWQRLASAAIGAVANALVGVRVTFTDMSLAPDRATFRNVLITSRRNEPIATIPVLRVGYVARDWLPGGKRQFGLSSVDAESPHLTIVRRPDGTYNVSILHLQAGTVSRSRSLIATVRIRNGSIDVIDRRPQAVRDERSLYVRALAVSADISTAARSRYTADLLYGERTNALYPIRGRGDINAPAGYIDQHWTAPLLPVAAAVNFIADSSSLQFLGGILRHLDARYAGVADARGALAAHLAASCMLDGGRIAITGLARPIDAVRGTVDVYDDGMLTRHFDARLGNVPLKIAGGIYGLQDPHLRMTARGSTDAARLRSAFTQAQRLPVTGRIAFSLLVEGAANKPVTWISLRSPELRYASTALDRLSGLVAFDGRHADVIDFRAAYQGLNLTARGQAGFQQEPDAVRMLTTLQASPGGIPFAGALMGDLPLDGVAVATADDPKAISVHGVLWGSSPGRQFDALVDVDQRGTGFVGPLHLRDEAGSLYGRIALDRPHNLTFGILRASALTIPSAHAIFSGTLFGAAFGANLGAGAAGELRGAWGTATAQARLALRNGSVRGSLFGNFGGAASFAARVSGTPQSPRVEGTAVAAGMRYHNFNVNGNAAIAYRDGSVFLHDTQAAIGPLFIGLAGTIEGIAPASALRPRYDLAADVHTSDAQSLVATVQPQTAELVQGSLDADVRVKGVSTTATVAGRVRAPEGAVNGLAFRDFSGDVTGWAGAFSVTGGRVLVGSSALAISANATAQTQRVALDASNLDLSDLNDFFDAGDMFAGKGHLRLDAALRGQTVESSTGVARFTGARFRRLDLGNVAANWHTSNGRVLTVASIGGPAGIVNLAGSLTPSQRKVNVRAGARNVDLAAWLPMLGLNVPVTGHLDADATVAGAYPDVAMQVHAAVFGGTAGRLPVQRFEVTASAAHGRGVIRSAILEAPSLTTTLSGQFGVRPEDRLALSAHTVSPDVQHLFLVATGTKLGFNGTLDSTLSIEGTRGEPRLHDIFALRTLRYRDLTIPQVKGDVTVDRRAVRIASAEVDFTKGRAWASAVVPIEVAASGVASGRGPISAQLRADDLELSNFASLLPKGSQLAGRVDGEVSAHGTTSAPALSGSLGLRGGTFSGPMERSPIENVRADLSFAGTRAMLQSQGSVGAGSVAADGSADFPSLLRPAEARLSLRATAVNARFDLPDYFTGVINGDVAVERNGAGSPVVSGSVVASDARIPATAFLSAQGGDAKSSWLPDIAFNNLKISAGPNLRVQSRNVDIGATGDVTLAGSLKAPTLAGSFESTSGSLSFYRNFNLERGEVRFDPSSGVIPDVNAVATTFVNNPATAIRLHVTGPATSMNLALASDPPYSRQQILGILVGAQQFGAVQGVHANSEAFSATSAATNVALGQLNTVFTRTMLEPLSSSVASALGFTEVQITTDVQSGVGLSAMKAFGKTVTAIFSQTFGYPRSQSIALEAHPNIGTGLRLVAFTSEGPTLFSLLQPQAVASDVMNLNRMTSFIPTSGTNGIAFSFLRKFP
ncbi:MAG: translocation/assembly module TamB domain-containing protein [Candidatus Eremiobacteraeota bacterium]|nr:translocation/assembly module TamB domain-containing protein [Candidatus Eremiobacteraeota bacterium]